MTAQSLVAMTTETQQQQQQQAQGAGQQQHNSNASTAQHPSQVNEKKDVKWNKLISPLPPRHGGTT